MKNHFLFGCSLLLLASLAPMQVTADDHIVGNINIDFVQLVVPADSVSTDCVPGREVHEEEGCPTQAESPPPELEEGEQRQEQNLPLSLEMRAALVSTCIIEAAQNDGIINEFPPGEVKGVELPGIDPSNHAIETSSRPCGENTDACAQAVLERYTDEDGNRDTRFKEYRTTLQDKSWREAALRRVLIHEIAHHVTETYGDVHPSKFHEAKTKIGNAVRNTEGGCSETE